MGKTTDVFFSPSEACITSFGTIKASQQGGTFLGSPSFISLFLVSKVCGLFNNRILGSVYCGQLKAMTIAVLF